MAYPTSLPTFGTQPKQGPLIVAYKDNPLAVTVRFPVDYVIPEVTAAILRDSRAVSSSLQPTVTADDRLRIIELSAAQVKKLYQQTELVIYLGGVARLICQIETTTDPTRKTPGDSLSFTIDGDLILEVSINDTDAVRAAMVQAGLAAASATLAGTHATNAENSATAAANSASAASTSEANAANSATAAGTSATNAANSATTATTQAGIATTKAGEAATSAATASNAATAAGTSATNADTAKTAAEAARDTALNAAPWNPVGEWNAATNTPTITAGASGGVASGRGYDCTVAGTSSITGASVSWGVGDQAKWNGVKWVRVPASSLALSKTNWQDTELERLALATEFAALRLLSAPLSLIRLNSSNVDQGAGNGTQTGNADRTITVTGNTTGATGIVTYYDTGIPMVAAGVQVYKKIIFEAIIQAFRTADPQIGIGFVAAGGRVSYVYRNNGQISKLLGGASNVNYANADADRAYVVGDIIRVELHLIQAQWTLKVFKNGVQIGTNYTPSETPTGNLLVAMRGDADFKYSLTTEMPNTNTAAIDTAKDEAKQYTRDYTQPLYDDYDIFSRLTGTGYLPLAATYILDAVGDYFEVAVRWTGTSFVDGLGLVGQTNNANNVGFFDNATFYVRGNNASDAYASWTYPAGWSADFRTIRLEVAAGNLWQLSVDGVSLGTQPKLNALHIGTIGNAYNTWVKADIKSLLIHNATQNKTIGLLTDEAGAVNAPTSYEKKATDTAVVINLPDVYYEYSPTGYSGQPRFLVYARYGNASNYYIRFEIVRYYNTGIRADCYRIVGASDFRLVSGAMVSQGNTLLTNGESEAVYQQNGKSDYTGGVHGDEKYTFVRFLVNGIALTSTQLASAISLTACRDFTVSQLSDMFETDNATDVVEATHKKRTRIRMAGYDSWNRFDWLQSIVVSDHPSGIASMAHAQAEKVVDELMVERTMTTSTGNIYLAPGLRRLDYYHTGNKLGAVVTSRIIQPAAFDAEAVIRLWDTANYAKYYRQVTNKTTQIGDVWESEQQVFFSRL